MINEKSNEVVPMGKIPGLDTEVSRLFFGTANPPISKGDSGAFELLDRVFGMGINAFDCARSYGVAEATLGRWMEDRGCRDKVVVLSKCGDVQNGKVQINRTVIMDQFEKSLEALRTNCIDIYLLHRDDPCTPVSEVICTLNDLKQKGQIKTFGVSNWTHNRIEEANKYAVENGLSGFSVSSPNYGLTRQIKDLWGGGCVTISGPENEDARKWYIKNQMPIIAYSSLGRGFFSGRFSAYDYDTARNVLDEFAIKGYLYEENMLRLKKAEEMAYEYNSTVSEIAMRYIFSGKMNVFAVVSSTSDERMKMNIRSATNPLSAEDIKYLEADN